MRIGCGFSVYSQAVPQLDSTFYSYFIKDGRVSEAGTHDELIARRGDYCEYTQLQALNATQ
jgi:hypothetical protein